MKIENNTFLVTGGASGLGEATVRELHRRGARVLIADRDVERGPALAKALGKFVIFQQTDVSSEQDAARSIEAATERLGLITGLINCAGIGFGERVVGKEGPHELASFVKTINVNLVGTFNMVRLVSCAMSTADPHESGERGVIVNTSSVAAFDGQIGQVAYAASKAGIAGMTLPLARDLARYGIRVLTIAPGLFMTPLSEGTPPELLKAMERTMQFPLRWGRPDEYAALVMHIIENVMLNGETIRLDGAIRLPPC